MNRNVAPANMNYTLNKPSGPSRSVGSALKSLWPLIRDYRGKLLLAAVAMLANSLLNLFAPYLIGHAVDTYIVHPQFSGVLWSAALLLVMYAAAYGFAYFQTISIGSVSQQLLYRLRNALFTKIQELPIAFFNQNKAGDLISRLNNDTDKLNQFFSQYLMQFVSNVFIMIGAAIFLVALNVRLGSAALLPAVGLLIFTQLTGSWIKRKNADTMKALGGMSSEIQESLNNFKVIIAFHRRDYFRNRFQQANDENYDASVDAGIANNIYQPVYGLLSNVAQVIVLGYGVSLILSGHFTLGLLVSFLTYVNNFYMPLRQMATFWSNFQAAMAAWDRISDILSLTSDLVPVESESAMGDHILEFKHVTFRYPDGKEVLHHINFELEKGKTYALVGPTGGGKTTTASLMARLYDPSEGTVLLDGRDMRSYSDEERTKKIGFILQEPFLFTGTLRDNLIYGNEELKSYTNEQLEALIRKDGLEHLLERFEKGLDAEVLNGGEAISLGQRQLIAFMRAVLRHPDILILDEATANVDTVTEQLLQEILDSLPKSTTRVVIAHRLNTIENADEIFFVNSGEIVRAGSLEQAVELLMHGKRKS